MTPTAFKPLFTMLKHLPYTTEATFNAVQAVSNVAKQAVLEKADDQLVVRALVDAIALMLFAQVSADRRAGAASDALSLLRTRLNELAMFDGIEQL